MPDSGGAAFDGAPAQRRELLLTVAPFGRSMQLGLFERLARDEPRAELVRLGLLPKQTLGAVLVGIAARDLLAWLRTYAAPCGFVVEASAPSPDRVDVTLLVEEKGGSASSPGLPDGPMGGQPGPVPRRGPSPSLVGGAAASLPVDPPPVVDARSNAP